MACVDAWNIASGEQPNAYVYESKAAWVVTLDSWKAGNATVGANYPVKHYILTSC